MQKSITFSADEALVEKARAKARAGNKELEDLFRAWLEDFTRGYEQAAEEGARRAAAHREVMAKLSQINTGGRKFTREEMNERQPVNDTGAQEASREELLARHRETMAKLKGKVVIGRKLTREEMNER